MKAPRHIREKRKAIVEATVSANKSIRKADMPTSKGYRMSPSPTISHRISMHPGKGAGRKAELLTSLAQCLVETKGINTKYVSVADSSLTAKQRATKYRERGPYKTAQRIDHADNRCMVKVGVTPAHYVPLKDKDTGEERLVKVPAKDKWKEVGTP